MHVGLADVLREEDELEAAASQLQDARELGDAASLPENRYRWFATKAGILQAHGDLDGALTMLEQAQTTYQPGFFPNVRPIPAMKARLQIARNNLVEAEEWARMTGVTPDDPPTYLGEFNQLTSARLVVAKRRAGSDESLDPVLAMLDRILEAAETAGRAGSVIEARLVRALTHAADGNTDAATYDLVEALTAGVPAGYRRLFLDEGAPMQDLLRAVIQERAGVAAEHADRLLRVARQEPGPASAASDEGLSDREPEVVRLLATDLTGPEIASHMYVSVNTLRTHTKHIFTKLGVNTRRAAVSRATELGLL
jgi:LuxR family maltose regulon positive regulatory protein